MYADILIKLEQMLAMQHQLLGYFAILKTTTTAANEWLDNADVKRLLKISDSSLYRLRKTKLLPAKRIAGKWYYQLSILQAMAKS